tara:strand:- start:6643 stop:7164 length:522 start_codon:yes stop_codon:yes gene_type:complete
MNHIGAYIGEACRFYVMLLLFAGAAGKFANIRAFQGTLEILFDVPGAGSGAVAIGVVAVEVLVAFLLLIGGEAARVGITAAAVLFLGFTGVISMVLLRRTPVACNCFGGASHEVSISDLVRSVGSLAACAFYVAQFDGRAVLSVAGLVMMFGVALITAILSIRLSDIVSLSFR